MTFYKTHIEFRSDSFPQTPQEKEVWDEQVGGILLAQYLAVELEKHGIEVLGFNIEDWGYLISLSNEQFSEIFIGCNHYLEYENGFLVFIHPSKPIIKKWFFKKIDISEQLTILANILNEILTTNPEIYAQHWWSEEEMHLMG
ncbi:hypothetical protein [Acinetobacter sp. Marseille-Q1618]|uniref:hypothetical protein n=1 Tax=Acinetobacter sp. Marseille-Q1618 TaxID=2697502 RepID=UPI00156DF206|nr:hypothetical protein [Acinetobacter sp. Marseille-Q1618]